MAQVTLKHVYKHYKTNSAARDINLSIQDGEFIVLVGPSGCGKSTTLRMIAGLEEISQGDLFIDQTRVNDLPPRARDIAMVFQSYALYPHMTVRDNMAFGLKVRKFSKEDIAKRVNEVAISLGIEALLERKPKELSGGQKQRVAMGRAIVRRPKVFLFDEPLSNLDAGLRVKMRAEIVRLHRTLQATTIYVTHDQVEAMTLADRLVVMNQGLIQQVGTPKEVFSKPKNLFVASFLGSPPLNIFAGKFSEDGTNFLLKNLFLPVSGLEHYRGKEAILGVRPQYFLLKKTGIPAVIEVVERTGTEAFLHAKHENNHVIAQVDPEISLSGTVTLAPRADAFYLFDKESQKTIYPVESTEENPSSLLEEKRVSTSMQSPSIEP